MIHYHGTPITPKAELQKLAGKHFCVSFSDPRDVDWCMNNAQSVMLDNGAFSSFTRGKTIDVNAYYQWLESRVAHPHWAVIPDIIGGEEVDQRKLIAGWPFPKIFGAPVWHMDLSIDWLIELADSWPRICFGSSGRYWQVGSEDWSRRTDHVFNELAKRHKRLPWIHLMRGMSLAGDKWPFASTDSTNVARNFKRNQVCPERMARIIDAVQCPVTWETVPEQNVFCLQ